MNFDDPRKVFVDDFQSLGIQSVLGNINRKNNWLMSKLYIEMSNIIYFGNILESGATVFRWYVMDVTILYEKYINEKRIKSMRIVDSSWRAPRM